MERREQFIVTTTYSYFYYTLVVVLFCVCICVVIKRCFFDWLKWMDDLIEVLDCDEFMFWWLCQLWNISLFFLLMLLFLLSFIFRYRFMNFFIVGQKISHNSNGVSWNKSIQYIHEYISMMNSCNGEQTETHSKL